MYRFFWSYWWCFKKAVLIQNGLSKKNSSSLLCLSKSLQLPFYHVSQHVSLILNEKLRSSIVLLILGVLNPRHMCYFPHFLWDAFIFIAIRRVCKSYLKYYITITCISLKLTLNIIILIVKQVTTTSEKLKRFSKLFSIFTDSFFVTFPFPRSDETASIRLPMYLTQEDCVTEVPGSIPTVEHRAFILQGIFISVRTGVANLYQPFEIWGTYNQPCYITVYR